MIIAAAVILLFYPIDRETNLRMAEELERRRRAFTPAAE